MASASDLLLLADGRLPAGGHAHSGGLEQAVELGDVRDAADLERFLNGLLQTAMRTSITVAAQACAAWHRDQPDALLRLDAEESARTPSAVLRSASRAQGRQLLRAAAAIWPQPELAALPPLPQGPHLALAQGITAARLRLAPIDAARLAAYGACSAAATAAVRLLGLDPFSVHAVIARVMRRAEPHLEEAASLAELREPPLPGLSVPLLEIGAELHRAREIRMFAS